MFSIFGGGKVVCTGMVSYCNFFALFSVFGN
jgi:TATA-box binding protein (TBP) (component of TFIID and TFIIIB)